MISGNPVFKTPGRDVCDRFYGPCTSLQLYSSFLCSMARRGTQLLLLGNYKMSIFFCKNHMLRQPGLPSIFLRAQLCGFKITLVYHLIWNNLKIQYFIYIWDGFTVPSLMDTVQDRNHYFLVIPVITLNKPRAVILFGKLQMLPCGTKNLREFIFADW